jgi:acetyl esterase/lipase
MIDRRMLVGGGLGMLLAGPASAQAKRDAPIDTAAPDWTHERVALWPGSPPGATQVPIVPRLKANPEPILTGVATPFLAVFRPAKPDGRSLLVIPGGGYVNLAIGARGADVARLYNAEGITAFVLVYRLPTEGWAERWNVPLQDAQRAIRLIRANATGYGIDPAKLGVIGFSAGGHLAAMTAVGHADKIYEPVDAADQQPVKPAFAGLFFPALTPDVVPASLTFPHLFGTDAPAEARARYLPMTRVTAETPPLFIAHALDDKTVSPDGSIQMLQIARKAGIVTEGHFFTRGGHGLQPRLTGPTGTGGQWADLFSRWMRDRMQA